MRISDWSSDVCSSDLIAMNMTTRISKAERVGRWLARGWRGYVRGERWLSGWLVAQGVSASVATILRWTFNLVALGVLLYAAFWLALLLVFAIAAAWAANNADGNDESETEWRNGPAGFGLYTSDGFRIDPHVYDDD